VPKTAVVVGAGVIGLTTAAVLAEAGHSVVILAAAPPQRTTSRAAAAIWAPAHAGPAESVRAWGHETLATLRALAGEPGSGVRIAQGTMAWHAAGDAPSPAAYPGVAIEPLAPPPEGCAGAVRLALPVLDMPRHLDYLEARVRGAGVDIELCELHTLEQAAGRGALVVNCSGIGARALAADTGVRPLRGEHVVVENPGLDEFFLEEWAPGQREWTSWWPHGEVVVIGGSADEDWSLAPDAGAAARMLERAAAREPRLRGARILEQRVGLRPVREPIRLEVETIAGVRCVHNYGHGRSGVSLAWGCARAVAALAL
jgi:D-amino-acid oxidase